MGVLSPSAACERGAQGATGGLAAPSHAIPPLHTRARTGLLVCTKGIANGSLTVGDAVLFVTLMQQLYAPLNFCQSWGRAWEGIGGWLFGGD